MNFTETETIMPSCVTDNDDSTNVGMIVSLVVSNCVTLVTTAAVLFLLNKRRKYAKSATPQTEDTEPYKV